MTFYENGQWWESDADISDGLGALELPAVHIKYLQKHALEIFEDADYSGEAPDGKSASGNITDSNIFATVEGIRSVISRAPHLTRGEMLQLNEIYVSNRIFRDKSFALTLEEKEFLEDELVNASTATLNAAVERAVDSGPNLDEETLLDIVGDNKYNIASGVQAARKFNDITPLADGAELGYNLG